MKKLIVCFAIAGFATLSLSAGDSCGDKTACAGKAQASCCAAQAKSARASKAATAARKAATVKGAQLLVQR